MKVIVYIGIVYNILCIDGKFWFDDGVIFWVVMKDMWFIVIIIVMMIGEIYFGNYFL